MKFEKKYTITKWTSWHDDFYYSALNFFDEFSIYPNLLEANRFTHSQIDFIIQIDPIHENSIRDVDPLADKEGEGYKTGNTAHIVSFEFTNAKIDFLIYDELADKEFNLIFDDDPEFEDGEIKPIIVNTDEAALVCA